MSSKTKKIGLETAHRAFLMALTLWMLLQLPRLIAVPLIMGVLDGTEPAAWMYPAVLDVVVAVPSPLLAVALWRRRGLAAWTATIVYLVISIVDHGNAVTASLLAGTPTVFSSMSPDSGAHLVPGIQTAIDLVFLVWVTRREIRDLFFTLDDRGD